MKIISFFSPEDEGVASKDKDLLRREGKEERMIETRKKERTKERKKERKKGRNVSSKSESSNLGFMQMQR